MTDTESFPHTGASDSSYPGGNPYYKPSIYTFYAYNESCWNGFDTKRRSGQKEHKKNHNIYFPDPIVEEPESATSSPVMRAHMLGKF